MFWIKDVCLPILDLGGIDDRLVGFFLVFLVKLSCEFGLGQCRKGSPMFSEDARQLAA